MLHKIDLETSEGLANVILNACIQIEANFTQIEQVYH